MEHVGLLIVALSAVALAQLTLVGLLLLIAWLLQEKLHVEYSSSMLLGILIISLIMLAVGILLL